MDDGNKKRIQSLKGRIPFLLDTSAFQILEEWGLRLEIDLLAKIQESGTHYYFITNEVWVELHQKRSEKQMNSQLGFVLNAETSGFHNMKVTSIPIEVDGEMVVFPYLAFDREYGMKISDAELLAEYGEKVKQLIQQHVDYEGITKNFRELNVNDLYVMERLNKMDDEEKALNLEKMLKQEISINIDTNPAYKKFSERLAVIRKEFEQHQIDLAERIKRYQELLGDIKKKGDEAKELGYSLKEYGLYIISTEFIEGNKDVVREFIQEMTKRFEGTLDEGWQESSKREEFLKEVKRIVQELVLSKYKDKIKVVDFHKYLNRLVDIVIKKF